MKTYAAKLSHIKRQWWVIDAQDLVLGRLASRVALVLRGKHKPMYTPNLDCGDNVIIINADKIHLTGKKLEQKVFYWHTGYPGGIKDATAQKIISGKFPERLLHKAVERMIDRNALGRAQMKKLFIYAGDKHPHEAQQPQVLDIASFNKKNKKQKDQKEE